jgi:hypothetical protein
MQLDLYNLPPRLRRSAASEYLWRKHGVKVAPASLAKLACIGGGPPFQKDGPWPTYPIPGLDQYAKKRLSRLVSSISELTAAENSRQR